MSDTIGLTPYEFYKAVEGEWEKLVKKGKDHTPAAKNLTNAMDFWWSRMSKEEHTRILVESRNELLENFESSFAELFPNEPLLSEKIHNPTMDAVIDELEKPYEKD